MYLSVEQLTKKASGRWPGSPRMRLGLLALTAIQVLAFGAAAALWCWFGRWDRYPVLLGLVSAVVLIEAAIKMLRWSTVLVMKRPEPLSLDSVNQAELPKRLAAITTFVPGAEPLAMLRRTLRAMANMRHAHDTWVLDEGDDPDVKALCKELGVLHFTRKGIERYHTTSGAFRTRTKYGNVNAWLDAVGYEQYDLVCAFDPDHVPLPHFIEKALPYFADPMLAYVQFPQNYYNQQASIVARGAAEETYLYYGLTQCVAHASGWPVVVGCHNTHRVSALRDIGGFAAHDADDMLISYLYRQAGYRGVYDPTVVAYGLTPTNWEDFLKQQERWSFSVFDIKFRQQPRLKLGMGFWETILNYALSLAYLQAFVTVAGIVALTWMLAAGPELFDRVEWVLAALLTFAAATFLGTRTQRRWLIEPKREGGIHYAATFVGYAKFAALIAGFWRFCRQGSGEYTITNKLTATAHSSRLLVSHALVLSALAGGFAVGQWVGASVNPVVAFFSIWIGGMSLAAILSERFSRAIPPYDDALAERELNRDD